MSLSSATPVVSTAQPKSQQSILLVDDSAEDLTLLTEYLRSTRFRITVAFDGREGYQKASLLLPDIILMDVRMPRTDGFAACRLLKADPRTRDIPVIFLSGCNELDDRLEGLHLGAVDTSVSRLPRKRWWPGSRYTSIYVHEWQAANHCRMTIHKRLAPPLSAVPCLPPWRC